LSFQRLEDNTVQTNNSEWIRVDRDGRSSFRYENKCQRGYFNCNTDCMNCSLGKQERIDKFGNAKDYLTNISPNFRNLKFFTKSNIDNHSLFEHRSSREG
jgi:hypothetical protein